MVLGLLFSGAFSLYSLIQASKSGRLMAPYSPVYKREKPLLFLAIVIFHYTIISTIVFILILLEFVWN